jgi:adenine-specific DNA-methyltransferase
MAKSKKPATSSVPIDANKHVADTRSNIPTRETAAFATDDGPQKFVVNRDRSLDPQLVWRGKDEQDAKPLEVPAVPIHVQEKIHPQAVIEAVKGWARASGVASAPRYAADLFSDFNGLDDFSKKLEFYQHDQHWTNRLILGDSLLVMASIAEKERLRGKVQCVYFDPPYGIKFGSNWQVSTRKRDVKDAKAEDLTRQPEQIKAFRDTWELGIHSYLSYMRDRLAAARDLLTESGSIFVQIGDENVHLVRSLMDEVFGSENFCSLLTFQKTAAVSSPEARTNVIGTLGDFILWYARDLPHVKYRQLYLMKGIGVGAGGAYRQVLESDGTTRPISREELDSPSFLPKGARVYQATAIQSPGYSEALSKPFTFQGKEFTPASNAHWKTTLAGLERLAFANRLVQSGSNIRYVRFVDDFGVSPLGNIWSDVMGSTEVVYVVQTNTKVIERCILMTTDPYGGPRKLDHRIGCYQVVPLEGPRDGQAEPNAHAGFQSASGSGCDQGRSHHQPGCRALRDPRQPRGPLEEATPRRSRGSLRPPG